MVKRILIALLSLSLGGWNGWNGYPNLGNTSQPGSLGHSTTITTATCAFSITNATTYDFTAITTNVSDGEAVALVVGIMAEDNAADFGVASATATVGGKVMTMAEITDENGTDLINAAMYITTEVTQDASVVSIQPTFSEGVTGAAVCVWTIRGGAVGVTSSVNDDDTAGGDLILTTSATTVGGYVLCVSASQITAAEAVTWTVVSEVEDADTGEFSYSNAQAAATGSSMANIANWDSGSNQSGACAALR